MPSTPAATGDLFERDAALCHPAARVQALADEPAAGGGCIGLSGEAGVGKTSLLQALRRCSPPTVQWLWSLREPLLSPPPLSAMLDMPEQFEVRLRIRRAHAWLMLGHWDWADDEAARTMVLPELNAIEREQAQHLRRLVGLRRQPDAPALQPGWIDLIDGRCQLAVDPWQAAQAA